jgi:hypothetical protein
MAQGRENQRPAMGRKEICPAVGMLLIIPDLPSTNQGSIRSLAQERAAAVVGNPMVLVRRTRVW